MENFRGWKTLGGGETSGGKTSGGESTGHHFNSFYANKNYILYAILISITLVKTIHAMLLLCNNIAFILYTFSELLLLLLLLKKVNTYIYHWKKSILPE